MKNSTLIAIAALAACTTTADAQQFRHTRIHSAAPFAVKASKAAQPNGVLGTTAIRMRRAAAQESTTTYKPKTQTEAMYMEGEWVNIGEYKFSYDDKGREVRVDNESEDGITRNADNNVTGLTLAVPYNGKFADTQRITNTFDPKTKQATSFYLEELKSEDTWTQSQYIHSIVWKKTNGQLVGEFDNWQSYGNYIVSGTIGDYDTATGTSKDFGEIKVDYDAKGGFTETIDYTDVLSKSVTTNSFTDDNGSNVYEYKYYEDANEDGVLNNDDLVEGTVATVNKDANGNVTLDEVEEYGINEETSVYEKMGGSRYIYTYDPEHDNAMLTMQYEGYDSETKEYVPFARVTTTEFVSVSTGINNVKVQSADDASAVYTLQGVKTNAAGKGLYIVKRNGKFVKVMK